MRPWAWVRRVLALAVTFAFVFGVLVTPALAAGSRSYSTPKSSSTSSGSRSFSTPKPSAPSSPPRSYSTPKSSTPSTPPRTYSSPPPKTTSPSSPSTKPYSSSQPQGYSSGNRSYSSPDRSFSTDRPSVVPRSSGTQAPLPPPPTYDRNRTNYPTRPPVIIYGDSPYAPTYWHDWYYGRPWYWRMFHRPVYYGDSSSWAISWVTVVVFGIGIWILLGFVSAMMSKRRRL